MRTFYKIISFVFQPLLMPTFGMLMLVNMEIFSVFTAVWKLHALIGTFIFTGFLPAAPILIMMWKGDVKDLYISKKEERTLPYLFSFLAYIFWSSFLWQTLQFPLFLVAMGIGSAISILLITLINLKWKISAHLASVGGFAGGVFGICYRMAINPVWLLMLILSVSALVALSRIELKAHTPGQTLAGFILGFLAVFIPCVLL
ncbi:MAG: phosphatase PAP2 family protein [Paludibacter sp.]|nr:phosphatase PAP2 family protein [Paludibacter sp.]